MQAYRYVITLCSIDITNSTLILHFVRFEALSQFFRRDLISQPSRMANNFLASQAGSVQT